MKHIRVHLTDGQTIVLAGGDEDDATLLEAAVDGIDPGGHIRGTVAGSDEVAFAVIPGRMIAYITLTGITTW